MINPISKLLSNLYKYKLGTYFDKENNISFEINYKEQRFFIDKVLLDTNQKESLVFEHSDFKKYIEDYINPFEVKF